MPRELNIMVNIPGHDSPIPATISFNRFDEPALGFDQLAGSGTTHGLVAPRRDGAIAITISGEFDSILRFNAGRLGEEAAAALVARRELNVSGRKVDGQNQVTFT